jgi:hypothetical protein
MDLAESLPCEEKEDDSLFAAKGLSNLKRESLSFMAVHIMLTATFQGENVS